MTLSNFQTEIRKQWSKGKLFSRQCNKHLKLVQARTVIEKTYLNKIICACIFLDTYCYASLWEFCWLVFIRHLLNFKGYQGCKRIGVILPLQLKIFKYISYKTFSHPIVFNIFFISKAKCPPPFFLFFYLSLIHSSITHLTSSIIYHSSDSIHPSPIQISIYHLSIFHSSSSNCLFIQPFILFLFF